MSNSKKETKAGRRSALAGSIETLNSEAFIEEPHSNVFVKLMIYAIASALVFFWVWATITPVYEVVTGEGTIKPEGFVVPVEHLEGGRIAKIIVSEGSMVRAGDIILRLDDAQLRAEIEKNKAKENFLNAKLERLRFVASHDFAVRPIDEGGTALSDPGAPSSVQYQIAQIEHLRATRMVEETQLRALRKRSGNLSAELDILQKQAERSNALRLEGRTTLRAYEEEQLKLLKIEEEIANVSGLIDTHQAKIIQSHAKERELIAGFKTEAETKLLEAEAELASVLQVSGQLSQRLEQTVIRAARSGIVNNLMVRHSDEIIAPGASIAEIVPQDTDVFAEIEVPASKIGGIQEGSEAKLKVLTHDYTRYGDVTATVNAVSPNSYTKENGKIYFKVRLKFDRNALGAGRSQDTADKNRSITPGMTVTADIRTGQKTVLSYLVKPLRAISDRAFSES